MRAIRLAVIGSILLISFLTFLIQPSFASTIGEIPVINISPQNKMAILKTPVNTLYVIKAGEFLDKHTKGIDIMVGKIVFAEKIDFGNETVIKIRN